MLKKKGADEMRFAELQASGAHYRTIERVLAHIAEHWQDRPDLAQLARIAGLSQHHFQRVFSHWVGLSPKKFLELVTLDHARATLRQSRSVLDTTLELGLSGPGRLHDLFVNVEAMTPGEYARLGDGLEIRWGWAAGPFGDSLVMISPRGLCGLAFRDARGHDACFADMARRWPRANLLRDDELAAETLGVIFNAPAQDAAHSRAASPLRLLLKGSAFRLKVWDALMRLPPGSVTTYGELAVRLGMNRGGARAVGGAVGDNPISWLIPCHRVIRETGLLGGYRWGLGRKVAMLGFEAAGKGLRLAST